MAARDQAGLCQPVDVAYDAPTLGGLHVGGRTWIFVVVVILAAAHHDGWAWNDASLWFGFLPAGLGYHAVFSVVAACVWAGVTVVAWPADPLEEDA